MVDENTVFIGNKGAMPYVLAVVTQFNTNADEVVIKARGRSISRAVDVTEIVRNRFMPEVSVKDIKIGTEVLKKDDGSTVNVSSMEIALTKK